MSEDNKHLEDIVQHLKDIKELIAVRAVTPVSLEESNDSKILPVGILANFRSWFRKDSPYFLPGSIILAGLIIGLSLWFGNSGDPTAQPQAANLGNAGEQIAGLSDKVKKVDSDDHIRGAAKAEIKIVEFSDLQCPFCKSFHSTMQQVVNEFNGQVAWIYRHFPLESIHPRAKPQAIASECVDELGGNDKFWSFIDAVFASEQNNSDDQLKLMAQNIGINASKFESCFKSGKYDKLLTEDTTDAQTSGARGTPYSIVIAPNGKTFTINGAQPIESVRTIIEQALAEK